jgi:hypothetical protein
MIQTDVFIRAASHQAPDGIGTMFSSKQQLSKKELRALALVDCYTW